MILRHGELLGFKVCNKKVGVRIIRHTQLVFHDELLGGELIERMRYIIKKIENGLSGEWLEFESLAAGGGTSSSHSPNKAFSIFYYINRSKIKFKEN